MQDKTTTLLRAFGAMALLSALALAAGCHSSSAAQTGPDPAAANMAPVNGQQPAQVLGESAAYAPQQQGESYPQQAPAPIDQNYAQQPGYQPTPDEEAGEEALESTEAPPPLPEYDQPPAPGPDYLWTPGYWAWGPGGYYWVPGAWVEAPYYGALWTPPYWGWYGGYYRFHTGYWGPHVGYYGGINYGFGYIGIGYFGGYWSGNSFYYNRAVTRVGGGIRNVYERPVVYNNVRYGAQPSNRVSYNGGRGGINVQPRPTELAAARERHDPATSVQRQARVEASQNRAQSFAANRGRPAEAVAAHGFANSRGIAAPPRGVEAARPGEPNRPGAPNMNERAPNAARTQPYNNTAPRGENRTMPGQLNAAPRVENRTQPQPRAENPRTENRPAPSQPNAVQPRYNHQPSAQPQPRNESRPMSQPQPRAEAPRPESRPQQPQARPMPQQSRPAPQQRAPAARPESHPAPQAHGGDEHGHR